MGVAVANCGGTVAVVAAVTGAPHRCGIAACFARLFELRSKRSDGRPFLKTGLPSGGFLVV